ncbi:MAG: lysophospholipid acyltransferase family protein [Syntrophaceae bacterium]|nr:lysophospholipid acyltransferase family protein [Syntrophaceae bacterium]MBP7034044.1 lysophospholipid acyltransferase family protein [Syntrophobacterales bacterium]NLX32301.1 lysophospholipid acyltransferase family protein [Deltaproteobacteria bacterium]HPG71099.1 lysophospholipid acyltransferase family protein [Syntrophales bacterium]HQM90977.1 lysophospholipid acyltransferase family protein [Syntrophales bacterium]
MLKKHRYALLPGPLHSAPYHVIRLYTRTYRMTVENETEWIEYHASGGTVLLCSWHQQFFSAIRHFQSYSSYCPSLMISRSKDGDIIARVAEKSGWHAVRGSSSRGGSSALKEMIERLKRSRLAGHIVDGPKGPAGIVKAGAISLARSTGAVIVPVFTSADRAWHFNSWDRFMIPKPFARVTLHFGTMFDPNGGRDEDFEDRRAALESVMLPGLIS